jgi:hypothetical protein
MIKFVVSFALASTTAVLLLAGPASAAGAEPGPRAWPTPAPTGVAVLLGGFPTCC